MGRRRASSGQPSVVVTTCLGGGNRRGNQWEVDTGLDTGSPVVAWLSVLFLGVRATTPPTTPGDGVTPKPHPKTQVVTLLSPLPEAFFHF